jgi:AbrB family looped-hinge helix DNA binding protein
MSVESEFARVGLHVPSADVAVLLSDPGSHVTLTIVAKVKERRRGASKISSKNQITIPAEALRSAGLEIGDRVVAHADGAGRVILEREHDVIAEFAGALTGAYRPSELDELRSEWD